MTDHKKALFEKIRALRARAADHASTENEAAIASRKAAELLKRHNLSLDEVHVRADGVERADWHATRQDPYEVRVLYAVGQLCNVKAFFSGRTLSVIGAPADVEVALYYLDIVKAAINSTWKAYRKSGEYAEATLYKRPARVAHEFKLGCALRLRERLLSIAKSQSTGATGSTSNALVPVKNAMIEDYMCAHRINLSTVRRRSIRVGEAFHDGKAAGGRVSLNRGVNGPRRGQRLLT